MDYKNTPLTLENVRALPKVRFEDLGQLPSTSGIYFVLYGDDPQRLAYVGKAKSFQRRWIGHHRIPECALLRKLGVSVVIAWFSCPEPELPEVERKLISVFSPPLNDGPTLLTEQIRAAAPPPTSHTVESILEEVAKRQSFALGALTSEEFWNQCNGDDGDLLTLWPFADGVDIVDVNMLWAERDNHCLSAFRVVTPPLFDANDSGTAEPNKDYEVSWLERRDWTLQVARQVDSFIFAVATFHASGLAAAERRRVFELLAKEPTLEQTIRDKPQLLSAVP